MGVSMSKKQKYSSVDNVDAFNIEARPEDESATDKITTKIL